MTLLEWYIPVGLLALLLFALLRARAYEVCPWFFAYSVYGLVVSLTRFASHKYPELYYSAYWISEAGYDVLGIAVMYEVLRTVLGGLARDSWARIIFPVILVAGVLLSLARAHAAPSQFTRRLAFYILTGEIAVRFVQVFIFAGLVSLAPLLGLRWRQYPFGIAAGFGLYATVSLLITAKLSDFGTRFMFLFNAVSLVAYSLAVLIWIWFFSTPQKVESPKPELSAPSPGDLKQYKDALRRMR
jgi:hypothetical protein